MSNSKSIVQVVCPFCGVQNEVEVPDKGWREYCLKGKKIQDAFPELTPSQRELLLTGMCDDCFPK